MRVAAPASLLRIGTSQDAARAHKPQRLRRAHARCMSGSPPKGTPYPSERASRRSALLGGAVILGSPWLSAARAGECPVARVSRVYNSDF
eukprot:603718-Prorocentrum_minimum.AAC.8